MLEQRHNELTNQHYRLLVAKRSLEAQLTQVNKGLEEVEIALTEVSREISRQSAAANQKQSEEPRGPELTD